MDSTVSLEEALMNTFKSLSLAAVVAAIGFTAAAPKAQHAGHFVFRHGNR